MQKSIKIIYYWLFIGNPDVEEEKIYEQSSPSSSSVGSVTRSRRLSRSASMASNATPEKQHGEAITPPEKRSIARNIVDSPATPGNYQTPQYRYFKIAMQKSSSWLSFYCANDHM